MSAIEGPEMPVEAGAPVPPLPGEDVPAPTSLQAKVRAARARAQQRSTIDLEIPGTDGTLWGTFRGIDDVKERVRIGKPYERIRDESVQAYEIAAEMLRVACIDCFVPLDGFIPGKAIAGDRFSLEMPLGKALAVWMDVVPAGSTAAITDHDAVFLIFPSTTSIVETGAALHRFSTRIGQQADADAEGNS